MALALALWLGAVPLSAETEVDVELFLAVDVSRSMTPAELEIQRRGYAEALISTEVINAIQSGMIGRIALTYVEWAGPLSQREIVGWRIVETAEQARAFARELTANMNYSMRRTSISGALDFAANSIEENGFRGLRRVIDISGDGPNNQGDPVTAARDRTLSRGIIINGLPLMTKDGLGSQWNLDDLDAYYADCVIGGPGAFVIPVYDWSQFAGAVKRKLVLEIAAAPPLVWHAQATGPGGYDCMIGEKIWEQFRRYYSEP